MIVPDHWAEARRQHRSAGRQITVRRYGWSDTSAAAAQAHAESRADEALQRLVAGEPLARREPRVAYNGAEGVPIREEVLARHGAQVITRNAYGARCLNSPNALFADIDFERAPTLGPALGAFAALALAAGLAGWATGSVALGLGLLVVALLAAWPLGAVLARRLQALRGGPERVARARLDAFLARHPHWSVRLYRTPAGLRVLATHQPCTPEAEEVQRFFAAVAADPVYVRMCTRQHCFRARLSAKPWRIGIATRLRPRPGVWPVSADRLPARAAWVADYEARAAAHAACRFVAALGPGTVHPELREVVELHDRESRALQAGLGLA